LPFLSWLPHPAANFYVKIFGHTRWDIYPLTLGGLKKLAVPKFDMEKLSLEIIKHPEEYHLDMYLPIQNIVKILPLFLLKVIEPILPSFIVLLRKK
jgi:hypothetical protein